MNYPVSSSDNGSSYTFILHLGLFLLLFFFIIFFVFEMVSFLQLFEVKMETNPATDLIK
ncbi:MAG: hypothetical protein ABI675_01970 [Chitinophagaceae bacterium]